MPFLRSLFIVVSLILTTGCVSNNFAKPITYFEENTATQGLVVISSVVNTGEVGQLNSLTFSKLGEEIETFYTVSNQIPNASRDNSLFVGALPPGEYQLTKVSSGLKYLDVAQSPFFEQFTIEAGKVTDLGRVVLTAMNFNVFVGRSNKQRDNADVLSRYKPEYVDTYQNNPQIDWGMPPKKGDFVEDYAFLTPQGMTGLTELENGEIIAGSRLGTVLVRSPEKKWRIVANTESFEAVMATASYQYDGNIAVVTDNRGVIYRLDAAKQLHIVDRGNLPYGNIFFIDHSQDYSRWIVGVHHEGNAEVYSSDRLSAAHWVLEKTQPVTFSAWSGGRMAWLWRRDNGVGLAATADKTVHCYDYSDGQWHANPTPDDRVPLGIAAAVQSDTFGILTGPGGGFGGMFAKTHLTRDCGQTWIETSSPFKVKVSAPLELPSGALAETGGVFGGKGMYTSQDDGVTWQKVSDDVVLNERLWVTKQHGLFKISNGMYGIESVYNSTDDGRTWRLEYTTYSPKLQQLFEGK